MTTLTVFNFSKYPKLFNKESVTYKDTGNGWNQLLSELCERIEAILPHENAIRVVQIKEKFGGLRFYYDLLNDNEHLFRWIDNIISEAEDKAWRTCETCGQPGEVTGKGWYTVLCKQCKSN